MDYEDMAMHALERATANYDLSKKWKLEVVLLYYLVECLTYSLLAIASAIRNKRS